MSRISEVVGKVPLCTLFIIILCVIVHIVIFLLEPPITNWSINARNVICYGELYRIVTSAFIHANIMHIGFNMMSTMAIGSGLETTMGTMGMAIMVAWSLPLIGFLYCGGEYLASMIFMTKAQTYFIQNAVGFSCVIFTLAVLECYTATESHRTLFGLITVPSRVYPWALMIVLQVVMPEVSFMGHFSGAVVGLLHAHGTTSFLLPSDAALREMDEWGPIKSLAAACPNYRPAPAPVLPGAESAAQPPFGLIRAVWGGIKYAIVAVWWALSAILQIVGLYNPQPSTSQSPPTENQLRGTRRGRGVGGDVELGRRLG